MQAYTGKPLLTLLTRRGNVYKDEQLTLRIIALDTQPVKGVSIRIRPLGRGDWRTVEALPVARAVWTATLPAATEDFEYQLVAQTRGGTRVMWPATAPDHNQTVIVRD